MTTFFLSPTACAAIQPGGSLNPLRASSRSNITLKAGSSTSLKVSLGSVSNLGISPASLYSKAKLNLSLSGMVNEAVTLNIANLSAASLPNGWKLEMGGDVVEPLASSSSVVGFDTINTVTRVELGDHSIGATLNVPSNTVVGTYLVRASVNVRGKSPVMIEWIAQVVAP